MSAESGEKPHPHYVLPETTILVVLGSLDLLTTVYLVATKQAFEANPLFAHLLRLNPWVFTLTKALFLAVPLAVAEKARRHNEQFVRLALRLAIILYIGFYTIAFARANAARIFRP